MLIKELYHKVNTGTADAHEAFLQLCEIAEGMGYVADLKVVATSQLATIDYQIMPYIIQHVAKEALQ